MKERKDAKGHFAGFYRNVCEEFWEENFQKKKIKRKDFIAILKWEKWRI